MRYWPDDILQPDNSRFWEEVDAEMVSKSRGHVDPISNLFITEGKIEVRGQVFFH